MTSDTTKNIAIKNIIPQLLAVAFVATMIFYPAIKKQTDNPAGQSPEATASSTPQEQVVNNIETKTAPYAKSNQYSSLKWQTEKIQEKNRNADINIEYPKFIGGQEVALLNEHVSGIVFKELSEDRALVQDWIKNGKSWIGLDGIKQYDTDPTACHFLIDYDYECSVNLNAEYKVYSIVNDIVSMEIIFTDFTGGGNGSHDYSVIVNYDLKTNRELKVSELFCDTNYPAKLALLVRANLYEEFKLAIATVGSMEKQIIDEGTEPIAENYSKILLGYNDLTIVFNPYVVASGGAGVVRVFLPYSDIVNIICLP